jgi:hypothetical protein
VSTEPRPSTATVVPLVATVNAAAGGRLAAGAVTVTWREAVPVRPPSSVTVSVTV